SLTSATFGSGRETAEDGPAQLLPETVDVLEPGRPQRRQVLVQSRREGPTGRGRRRPWPLLDHRREILRRGAFTMASRGRDAFVPLVKRSGRGVDQVRVQECSAGPQLRADVPVNLTDAREVAQVVQAAGGNHRVERTELAGQPAHVEEIGPMQ